MAYWERYDNDRLNRHCSACHMPSFISTVNLLGADLTPFCPWCGAEMSGWEDEQKVVDAALEEEYVARQREIEAFFENEANLTKGNS